MNIKNKPIVVIFDVDELETHGGSLRVYVSQDKNIQIEQTVEQCLKKEEEFGLKNISTYLMFGKKIESLKDKTLNNIKNLKKKYNLLVGYGAPAKATTSLNFFGITDQIDFIIEDNKLKHNKFVPGVNIQIKSKKNIKEKNIPIVVLAWNFFNEIKKNNKNLSEKFLNIKDLEK